MGAVGPPWWQPLMGDVPLSPIPAASLAEAATLRLPYSITSRQLMDRLGRKGVPVGDPTVTSAGGAGVPPIRPPSTVAGEVPISMQEGLGNWAEIYGLGRPAYLQGYQAAARPVYDEMLANLAQEIAHDRMLGTIKDVAAPAAGVGGSALLAYLLTRGQLGGPAVASPESQP